MSRVVLLAVLLAAALVLPFVAGSFLTFQLTQVLVTAIAILGLNLLTGISGQFSLGHGAFFAIGAYVAAIAMHGFGIDYGWTLPIAGIAGFAAGLVFGLPALRLQGVHLALATFALAVATPQILKLSLLERWTGGVQGIFIAKPGAPFDLPLNDDQWLYLLVLAAGILLYWIARNLVASRFGLALAAIRENPLAASTMGISLALYRLLAFGVGGLYAGVAGALSALVVQFVAPDSFPFVLSIALLVGLVVGGVGWLPGALIGGAFVVFVPNLAEDVSKGLSAAVYGVILILFVYLMPTGVGGLVRRIEARRPGRKPEG